MLRGIERSVKKVRGEDRRKREGKERGRKEVKDEKSLLRGLAQSQCGLFDLLIGGGSPKPLLASGQELAPSMLLQWLGSSYKGLFLMLFLASGGWLVSNLENSFFKVSI